MRESDFGRIVGELRDVTERLREVSDEESSQRVYDLAEELSELLERLGELV